MTQRANDAVSQVHITPSAVAEEKAILAITPSGLSPLHAYFVGKWSRFQTKNFFTSSGISKSQALHVLVRGPAKGTLEKMKTLYTSVSVKTHPKLLNDVVDAILKNERLRDLVFSVSLIGPERHPKYMKGTWELEIALSDADRFNSDKEAVRLEATEKDSTLTFGPDEFLLSGLVGGFLGDPEFKFLQCPDMAGPRTRFNLSPKLCTHPNDPECPTVSLEDLKRPTLPERPIFQSRWSYFEKDTLLGKYENLYGLSGLLKICEKKRWFVKGTVISRKKSLSRSSSPSTSKNEIVTFQHIQPEPLYNLVVHLFESVYEDIDIPLGDRKYGFLEYVEQIKFSFEVSGSGLYSVEFKFNHGAPKAYSETASRLMNSFARFSSKLALLVPFDNDLSASLYPLIGEKCLPRTAFMKEVWHYINASQGNDNHNENFVDPQSLITWFKYDNDPETETKWTYYNFYVENPDIPSMLRFIAELYELGNWSQYTSPIKALWIRRAFEGRFVFGVATEFNYEKNVEFLDWLKEKSLFETTEDIFFKDTPFRRAYELEALVDRVACHIEGKRNPISPLYCHLSEEHGVVYKRLLDNMGKWYIMGGKLEFSGKVLVDKDEFEMLSLRTRLELEERSVEFKKRPVDGDAESGGSGSIDELLTVETPVEEEIPLQNNLVKDLQTIAEEEIEVEEENDKVVEETDDQNVEQQTEEVPKPEFNPALWELEINNTFYTVSPPCNIADTVWSTRYEINTEWWDKIFIPKPRCSNVNKYMKSLYMSFPSFYFDMDEGEPEFTPIVIENMTLLTTSSLPDKVCLLRFKVKLRRTIFRVIGRIMQCASVNKLPLRKFVLVNLSNTTDATVLMYVSKTMRLKDDILLKKYLGHDMELFTMSSTISNPQ